MTQSIREKAIIAVQDAMEKHWRETPRFIATAAFDAAIKVLMEPNEQFLTGPFEEMLETQGHAQTLAESWRMLLKGASQ